ncbi:Rhodanese-like domain-containing protein [Umbelopsis sp. AD052]|nr:Rhodanese-like domain-containing protein [Umbelopsis sp. AD052]
MQRICRLWLAPYLHQSSACASRPSIQQFLIRFQRSKHSLAPSAPFRPLAFYALHALPETSLPSLESNIRNQLKKLDTVGRIYLAPDSGIGGINAQLSVPVHQVSAVQSVFDTLPQFRGVCFDYNYGMKDTEKPSFRNLKVLLKPHLVAVGTAVNSRDLSKKPIYLTPDQWHQQLSNCDKDTLLIDMRNHYEYDVGRFKNATKMNSDTFRESLTILDDLVASREKDEAIYMYCTGGIRCSVAGAYMANKGYTNVNMLKGGITNYGHYVNENKVEDSLFRGSNFTFDGRRGERITDDVLAHCHQCGAPCDVLSNCANKLCHLLFIQCPSCKRKHEKTCSSECRDVVHGRKEWSHEYNYHAQIRPSSKIHAAQE